MNITKKFKKNVNHLKLVRELKPKSIIQKHALFLTKRAVIVSLKEQACWISLLLFRIEEKETS